MTGKLSVVLSALLVCCGLSTVNAQYQARHLLIVLLGCDSFWVIVYLDL